MLKANSTPDPSQGLELAARRRRRQRRDVCSTPSHDHFAMVEKLALHRLDDLINQDPQAARILILLIRLLERGAGGVVVISTRSLLEILEVSESTITRGLRRLLAGRWVHRLKIGTAHALAVGKDVAWVGPRADGAHAVFPAIAVAARSEQASADEDEEPR